MNPRLAILFQVFLLLFGCATGASAQPLVLEESDTQRDAAPSMSWLADPEGSLAPQEAFRQLRAGRGTRLDRSFPTLGFRDGDHWLSLSLENRTRTRNWYLRLGRPHLDHLELWVHDSDGQLTDHRIAGAKKPFSERPIAHTSNTLPLDLAPGENYHLLMRIRGEYVLDLPAVVMDSKGFRAAENRHYLIHGSYAGLLVIMCLFNFLIFLSIRDASYFWYVLYLGTFGLNVLTREGLAFQFLWPEHPWWNHHSLTVLNLLTLSFMLFFVRNFLQLRSYRPRLDRFLLAVSMATLVAAPLSLMHFQAWVRITAMISVPAVVGVIILAVMQMRAGFSAARYFLLAFVAVAVAATVYVLKNHELIPALWPLEYAMQIGTSLEALLLSFSLAHRMTVLKTENERIQREANEALEDRVQERTRELNEALNARSEFLAMMSHEIRTPLNGIMGTVDMLRDSGLNTNQEHHLHIIERSSKSLLELIDDVLDYARIEAGKMPIDQHEFDLHRLTRECVELFQNRAQLNGNTLECDIRDQGPATALGDSVRLRQVLSNLVSNAVKFTHNGHVVVRLERDPENPDYACFEVEDTGIGIPAERMRQLFEHFSQLDNSSSRRYGGTGLGLAISRQLVEIMGGEIDAQSEQGSGSLFWFRLPLPGAEQSAAVDEATATLRTDESIPEPTIQRTARLLVVDDNHVNLMVAEGLCRSLGHEVEVAESGMEAIAVLMEPSEPFDLVLMDCEMPEMDGFETVRRIRALQQQGRIHPAAVVALTAHAVPDKIRACHEAGMISHIAKPVTRDKLDRELRVVLRGEHSGNQPSFGNSETETNQ